MTDHDPDALADDPVNAAFDATFGVILAADAGEDHDPVHAHALITHASDELEAQANDPAVTGDEAGACASLARRVRGLHAAVDQAAAGDVADAWAALRDAMFRGPSR